MISSEIGWRNSVPPKQKAQTHRNKDFLEALLLFLLLLLLLLLVGHFATVTRQLVCEAVGSLWV